MHHRIRGLRRPGCLLALGGACLALAACGSSSSPGDATSLLKQTFGGAHTVKSGNLSVSLTINPSGSSTLKGPITLGFAGPFQSLGTGKLPQSDFKVSISASGRSGSLAILSTGTNGYVTLSGTSYQMPASTYQKLESSFAQLASSPGGGSGSGTLSKLGINPLHWLVSPSIVGNESVGGALTTHIRAGVNVAALLTDLNTFLQKASSLGVSGSSRLPSSISQATRDRIAAAVKSPSFDVWTGSTDKTLRKLAIGLTIPVSGQISSLLGGLSSADIGLTMQYAQLNQPQTITAPSTVRPFTEFTAKLKTFLQTVQGTIGSPAPGASAASSSGSTGSGSSSAAANVQAYSQCIQAAGNDVAKMQGCASLLNGG